MNLLDPTEPLTAAIIVLFAFTSGALGMWAFARKFVVTAVQGKRSTSINFLVLGMLQAVYVFVYIVGVLRPGLISPTLTFVFLLYIVPLTYGANAVAWLLLSEAEWKEIRDP